MSLLSSVLLVVGAGTAAAGFDAVAVTAIAVAAATAAVVDAAAAAQFIQQYVRVCECVYIWKCISIALSLSLSLLLPFFRLVFCLSRFCFPVFLVAVSFLYCV